MRTPFEAILHFRVSGLANVNHSGEFQKNNIEKLLIG